MRRGSAHGVLCAPATEMWESPKPLRARSSSKLRNRRHQTVSNGSSASGDGMPTTGTRGGQKPLASKAPPVNWWTPSQHLSREDGSDQYEVAQDVFYLVPANNTQQERGNKTSSQASLQCDTSNHMPNRHENHKGRNNPTTSDNPAATPFFRHCNMSRKTFH